jgi:hypothetical protein
MIKIIHVVEEEEEEAGITEIELEMAIQRIKLGAVGHDMISQEMVLYIWAMHVRQCYLTL